MAEKDNLFMCQMVEGGARAVSMTGEHLSAMFHNADPAEALRQAMDYAAGVAAGVLHADKKTIWKGLYRDE